MGSAFTLNGRAVDVDAEESATLIDVLRHQLQLRATRFGCGLEQCGACTWLVEGEPGQSCTRLVAPAAGKSLPTLEGLRPDGVLPRLKDAFLAKQAGNSGYRLAALLLAAKAL